MFFHSPEFALLFVVTFMIYPWLGVRGQNALLVAANIIFYMWSGLLDSTLLAFVLLTNYLMARRISERPDWRTMFASWAGANLLMFMSNRGFNDVLALMAGGSDAPAPGAFVGRDFLIWNAVFAGLAVGYFILTKLPRRATIWAAIILNLANLASFKYVNFLLDNAASITKMLGITWTPPVFDVLLPLGISFYTFQIIAYQVDLYKGTATPPRHLGQFVLFISFFAQLIAGPILRAYEFLPQLEKRRAITISDVKMGALFILWGLVKKVVIGDTLATYVDDAFSNVHGLAGMGAWLGTLAFTFQIYCDFSGYSDVAVGLGHMFGLTLTRNFHEPYISTNPREFWLRWHVTLSRWLRDYLYIPLGGNRGSKYATQRNLMITMLLGGLWHGASWNFVIWGGIHGIWLALHRLWLASDLGDRVRAAGGLPYRAACHVGFWILMPVTWVFFRASTFGDAMAVLGGMVNFSGGLAGLDRFLATVIPLLILLHVGEHIVMEDIPRASRWWHKVPAPGRGFAYAATWLLIVVFLREETPFIYFRF